jgi:hypothetical protein
MKKHINLFVIVFYCLGITAFAQTGKLYDEASVTAKPDFPGGDSAYLKFINRNFSSINDDQEMVKLRFIVEADGTLSDIKAVEGKMTPIEDEAVRVMKLSPKWIPAVREGKAVRCIVKRGINNPYARDLDIDLVVEPADYGPAVVIEESNSIYNMAGIEKKPDYPGGINAFAIFFSKNFRSPDEEGINGKIYATFVIETDGSLSNIKIIRDIGFGTGAEVLRVLKLSPKWIPGEQNGKKVRVLYSMPFSIDTRTSETPIGQKEISGQDEPQMIPDTPRQQDENAIYNMAGIEVKPDFPGGMDKFYLFFKNNFKTPDEEGLNGKVYAMFVVEKDGSLTDIKVIRDIGFGTGKEVLRVLKLSPKWIPGMVNGKPVRVQYSIPISIPYAPEGKNAAPNPEKK